MEQRPNIGTTPKIAVPIRIRGMSQEHRFFDVQSETIRLTEEFIVVGIPILVELDSEVHVSNLQNQIGGTFRVAWVNSCRKDEFFSAGLELLDPEGVIWEMGTIPALSETYDVLPDVPLACDRCHRQVAMPVPEADPDSVGEGFTIAAHCDTCKGTTAWIYHVGQPSPVQEEQPPAPIEPLRDAAGIPRLKGRAPISLPIKIVRSVYGLTVNDICETVNISRTGIYFGTEHGYEVGEMVEVIVPYHMDSVALPVSGLVVRVDRLKGTSLNGVAIRLNSR